MLAQQGHLLNQNGSVYWIILKADYDFFMETFVRLILELNIVLMAVLLTIVLLKYFTSSCSQCGGFLNTLLFIIFYQLSTVQHCMNYRI